MRNNLTKYMMKACMVSIFVVLRRFALESMNSAISRSLSTSDCLGISEKDAAASSDKLTAAENIAEKRMAWIGAGVIVPLLKLFQNRV
jgi:hypothetical protein